MLSNTGFHMKIDTWFREQHIINQEGVVLLDLIILITDKIDD